MYACTYLCTCDYGDIYIYIYTHTHIERQRERHIVCVYMYIHMESVRTDSTYALVSGHAVTTPYVCCRLSPLQTCEYMPKCALGRAGMHVGVTTQLTRTARIHAA